MAISGTSLSHYSPAYPDRRSAPRVKDAQPLVTLVKDSGQRSAPPRERVIEGEVVAQPFATGRYSTETIFNRVFIEGAFRHQNSVDGEPRSSRSAITAYQNATKLGVEDGNGRLVDSFV